jgi:hypothetical protein
MQIIRVAHEKECAQPHIKFCAEPSPEAAARSFFEHYGVEAEVVYFNQSVTGRCSVYIPLPAGFNSPHSEGQIS